MWIKIFCLYLFRGLDIITIGKRSLVSVFLVSKFLFRKELINTWSNVVAAVLITLVCLWQVWYCFEIYLKKDQASFLVRAIISKVCISKTSRKINLFFERDEKFYALSLVRHSAQMRTILNEFFAWFNIYFDIWNYAVFVGDILGSPDLKGYRIKNKNTSPSSVANILLIHCYWGVTRQVNIYIVASSYPAIIVFIIALHYHWLFTHVCIFFIIDSWWNTQIHLVIDQASYQVN